MSGQRRRALCDQLGDLAAAPQQGRIGLHAALGLHPLGWPTVTLKLPTNDVQALAAERAVHVHHLLWTHPLQHLRSAQDSVSCLCLCEDRSQEA